MNSIKINFNKIVHSKAMNKSPYQNGIIFTKEFDMKNGGALVRINATNPKTNKETSYLEIQFPMDNVDQIIDALNTLKR